MIVWYQTKKVSFLNADLPRTIAEWNKLPEEIVNIGEIGTFKEATTTHLKQAATSSKPKLHTPNPLCVVSKWSVVEYLSKSKSVSLHVFLVCNGKLDVPGYRAYQLTLEPM